MQDFECLVNNFTRLGCQQSAVNSQLNFFIKMPNFQAGQGFKKINYREQ